MYPAGGTFDDESFEGQVNGYDQVGKGITPIMLSSRMHFMNAEIAANTSGDVKSETVKGLTQSLKKADDLGGPTMSTEVIDSYVKAFSTKKS